MNDEQGRNNLLECEKLFHQLKSAFGDEMVIDVVPKDNLVDYEVVGRYVGHVVRFSVNFDSGELVMSTSDPKYGFLSRLVPNISVIMNGKTPICSYDFVDATDDVFVRHTIEWSNDPDNRLSTLNAMYRFPYVRRNQMVFVETKRERDERLGFTSFSPLLFPDSNVESLGRLEKMVEKYSEEDAFLALDTLKTVYSKLQNKTWSGHLASPINISIARNMVLNKIKSFFGSRYSTTEEFINSIDYQQWTAKWEEHFSYEKKCEYMESKIAGVTLARPMKKRQRLTPKKSND